MVAINCEYTDDLLPLFDYYRYKGLHGGRDAGKSHIVAEFFLYFSLKQTERFLCTRQIQRSIKYSVKQLLDDKINNWGIAHLFKSTDTYIECPKTGSVFFFHGLQDQTANSIKSIEGVTKCWIEEGQTITRKSLSILTPTIRAPKSEIWVTWNPQTEHDAVGLLLFNNPRKDVFLHKLTWRDNRFFTDELRKDKDDLKRRDYQEYLHIWDGEILRRTEANVFKNWRVDFFEPPYDVDFLFGADWGFSKSPTVLVRFWVDMPNRKIFIDNEAYGVGIQISDIKDLFRQIPESSDWKIVADSASPELIRHMQQEGFNIVGSRKGKDSVEAGIKWLQDFDIIIHERCIHTIQEFTTYSYKINKDTGEPTPKLVDENNHIIDALRYGGEDLIKWHGKRSMKILVG